VEEALAALVADWKLSSGFVSARAGTAATLQVGDEGKWG
jgi:hypothetical protein